MQFRQITIIGVGLLGGSVGLSVRLSGIGARIIGCDPNAKSLEQAAKLGAIDHGEPDAAVAVHGSDLVILAAPIGAFEAILRNIAGKLEPSALVTDVGSTKRSVLRLAGKILPPAIHFVPSHPMAGGEKQGTEHARPDLLRDRLCILTPGLSTPESAVEKIESFWRRLGMRTTRMEAAEHDRLMSSVSHLPHLLAAALVSMQEPGSLAVCGNGFLDTTRIAAGDEALWRDILLDNADFLRESLGALQSQIHKAMSLIENGDTAGLRRWLDEAARRRRSLPRDKSPGESASST